MKTLPTLCAGALLAGGAMAAAKPALDLTPLVREVDRNHDGCMDHGEWQAAGLPESAYGILKDSKGCVTAAQMTTTPAPDGIDMNGDGKLTVAEFRAFDQKMSRSRRANTPDEPALSASARPLFRWWWPGAMVASEEIDRELDAVVAAGFGGVEIVSLPHQLKLPADRYGWATPAWNAAIQHALGAARRRQLQVDLTIGPAWPAVVPGLTADSAAASKELVASRGVVGGHVKSALTRPAEAPGAGAPQLVALLAYPCDADCATAGATSVDPARAVDLSAQVRDGVIDWQAPAGTWLLSAFWQRGTGQMDNMRGIEGPSAPNVTDPAAYAIDHFSSAGSDAVTAYWDAHLLAPATLDLLREVGASIFEDSLEISGDPHWTPALLAEFQQRHGYALTPYLPALFAEVPKKSGNLGLPEFLSKPKQYPFRVDEDTRARVVHDFHQTLSELYIEKHVVALKRWANGHGLKFRNQGYGTPVDSGLAASLTDIPEGESLGFANRTDSFRVIAAGRDLAQLKLLTDECCADFDAGYAMTWQKMLATIHANFSGGVNRVVLHGLAYADDAVPAAWPGWAPMAPFPPLGTGFAEAWGTRIPTWHHLRPIADYLARTQNVLQSGRALTDIAVYRFSHGMDSAFLSDPSLARAGYTFQYLSPALLEAPGAVVANGRLAPDGPSYKALVITGATAMPAQAAQRIADLAVAGLPVLLVGAPPAQVPGVAQAGEEASLKAQLARLQALPTLHKVASEAELPAALRKLNLYPDSAPAGHSEVVSMLRQDGGRRAYWLYNPSSASVDQEYSFAGDGVPAQYDAWTGGSAPLTAYRRAGGRVITRLHLAPGATTVVTLAPGEEAPHLLSTTADAAIRRGAALLLRSSVSGVQRAVLADGRAASVEVGALPTTIDLTHATWTLEVEDWQPRSDGKATPTATSKTVKRVRLEGLKPWPAIAGLEDVSGIGVYTVALRLPQGLAAGQGYYLDLGQVFDTATVTVNGVKLALDQVTRRVDVGPVLKKGVNQIRIEVATTLLNRMRTTSPQAFGAKPRQDYGLIGPVKLLPYRDTAIQ